MAFRDDSGNIIVSYGSTSPDVNKDGISQEDVTKEIIRSGITSGYSLKRITSAVTSPTTRTIVKKSLDKATNVSSYPDFSQTRHEYEMDKPVEVLNKYEFANELTDLAKDYDEASSKISNYISDWKRLPFGSTASMAISPMISEWQSKQDEFSKNVGELYGNMNKALFDWHPDTKIRKTGDKYEITFPYAGAKSYGTYKRQLHKSGFGGLFATAFTPEDPLGLASAAWTFAGDKQKGIDVKIQAMHRIKQIKSPIDFGRYWLESPMTQIGLSVVGGAAIKAISPYAIGFTSARFGTIGAKAVQIGGLATGAGLVGYAAYDIKQSFDIGDIGKGVAKTGMLGLQIGGAYAGYKSVSGRTVQNLYEKGRASGFKSLLKAEKKFYTRHPNRIAPGSFDPKDRIELVFGKKGVKSKGWSKIDVKTAKGTLIEEGKIGITDVTKYKPGIEDVAMSKSASQRILSPKISGFSSYTAKLRGISGTGKPLITLGRIKALTARLTGRKSIFDIKYKEVRIARKMDIAEIGGGGGLGRQHTVTIPKNIFSPRTSITPSFISSIQPSYFIPMVMPLSMQILKPKTLSKELSSPVFAFDSIERMKRNVGLIPSFKTATSYDTRMVVATTPTTATVTSQIFGSIQEKVVKTTPASVVSIPVSVIPSRVVTNVTPPPVIIPSLGLFGRGRNYGDFSLFGLEYKFRKVKIKSPFKGLGM